uniref:Uncharacterized protein n=1 Tax=Sipha flava TaxID=143950 RepID=A0A2S2QG72_9HEMI
MILADHIVTRQSAFCIRCGTRVRRTIRIALLSSRTHLTNDICLRRAIIVCNICFFLLLLRTTCCAREVLLFRFQFLSVTIGLRTRASHSRCSCDDLIILLFPS